ncbi:MAG: coiled-coil domain-containing protein [Pseudohaliea sp.]
MAQDFERVEPAPFDAAPVAAEETPAGASGTPRWVLPALGGLALLALLVVFWLPGRVAAPEPPGSAPAAAQERSKEAPAPAPAATPAGAERSPYAEAQAARLRGEAQDILAELLDVRENLENRAVADWGADAMAAVEESAAEGDERYRERDFEAAIARYREALEAALALEARIPEERDAQLAAAGAAIEAGDLPAAEAAVSTAEQLEPGFARTAALRERVEALPEVIAGLERATEAENSGDLAAAREALAGATAADPAHQRAAAELARVSEALTRQRFTGAMSEGYAALDDEAFDKARSAFRRAERLVPGSPEAAAALQEVSVVETAAKLRDLRSAAESAAAAEDWDEALRRYEAALALDPTVLFAQRGLETAEPRAALDKALGKVIDDPDRLADPAVAGDAARLLARARGALAEGTAAQPRLEAQADRLAALLERANTEVAVTLRSDGETSVTVYRVARLGTFEQRTLELRPGEYTAVGTRPGYRDVRETFRVAPEDPSLTVTVACTEAIR